MRLVLADDSAVMLKVMTLVCRGYGHDVHAVSDGLKAWESYLTIRPQIVVLDWMMPGLDGLEVCRRIRQVDVDRLTYVLIVTGRETDSDVSAVLEADADDYMPKAIMPGHMRARLQIAHRRLAERDERRKTLASLAHAQWLSAIGATALALGHEINNPLQVLIGEAQFLHDESDPKGYVNRQTKTIISQALRIAAVVKRLGELRHPETVEAIPGIRMLDLSQR